MSDSHNQFYDLLCFESSTELVDEVNRMAIDGWRPSGGIAVVREHSTDRKGYDELFTYYYQAMWRLEP